MIDTIKDGYDYFKKQWDKSRDVIEGGTEKLKEKTVTYLPKLPGQTQYDYEAYLQRAQFINFSARTFTSFVGQIFRKDPVLSNFNHDDFIEDVDLCGTNMDYFNREILGELLKVNRVGILVDYSEEMKRPYLTTYKAETIINWRESKVNGINQLSLVVLKGVVKRPDPDDYYKETDVVTYRVLTFKEGYYIVKDYEEVKQADGKSIQLISETFPVIQGNKFNFIPFYIVTDLGLTSEPKRSPLLDLININLGHYINSADYENALHFTGSSTIITRGWGDTPFPVGGAADFPVDGGAEFLTRSGDDALEKGMRHKEEQMAVMGSTILSGKGRYIQSAETARVSSSGEFATLANMSMALSASLTYVLKLVDYWYGGKGDVLIQFNTDFETDRLDPQELIAYMGAVQSGRLSEKAYFYALKQREVYPDGWTFEEEQQAIQEDMKNRVIKQYSEVVDMYEGNE